MEHSGAPAAAFPAKPWGGTSSLPKARVTVPPPGPNFPSVPGAAATQGRAATPYPRARQEEEEGRVPHREEAAAAPGGLGGRGGADQGCP